MTRIFILSLSLAVTLVAPVFGQGTGTEAGRGVARISLINGDVSVRRGDSGNWVAAAVNGPVVAPDSVYAAAGSRAEVQLDWANMVRLAAETEVRFSELETSRYQLKVARGTITFSVLRDTDADVDLSTPNVSVRPLKKGRYRITVRADGTTEVTVRSGQAAIYSPQGVEYLKSGKTMLVRGPLGSPEFQVVAARSKDDWDRWNEQRDNGLKRSASYQYVSPDINGAEDLDGYGSWVYVPPYGYVWAPRVAAGWAPYRYGRWSWLDWYGWNWVSYDPWGWAPYHYGRWFHQGSYGWLWWPGAIHARHYWSPGLVAFFGWNSYSGFNLGVGFGFGNVGWVPLAPYERYHPWYGHGFYGHHGGRYGRGDRTRIDNSVNIVNNVNVTNLYRNARVRGGVTAVDGSKFGRGNVRNTFDGNTARLRKANLVRGQLPVVPGRESLQMTSRTVRASARPTGRSRSQFYTRRAATSPTRESFADQQRNMEQLVRRASAPAARSAAGVTRTSRGGGSRGAFSRGGAPPAANSGGTHSVTRTARSASSPVRGAVPAATRGSSSWRRFGEPARTSRGVSGFSRGAAPAASQRAGSRSYRSSPATRTSRSGGWRRFGEPSRVNTPVTISGMSPTRTSRANSPAVSRSRSGSTNRSAATRSSGGWERFTSRSGAARISASPSRSRTVNRTRPSNYPSRNIRSSSRPASRSIPRSSRRSSPGYSRSSAPSVRIAPPIVRQRATRSYGGASRSSRSGPSPSIFGGGRTSSRPSGGFGGSHGISTPSRSSGGSFGRSSGGHVSRSSERSSSSRGGASRGGSRRR